MGFGKYIAAIPGRHTIAIPYKIGCGLAGGDWAEYLAEIGKFGEEYEEHVEITIYQMDA